MAALRTRLTRGASFTPSLLTRLLSNQSRRPRLAHMVAFAAADHPTHHVRSVIGSLHREITVPNQDAHLTLSEPCVYAVLDGHGPDGHALASRAAHALVANVADHLTKRSLSAHAALLAAFTATAELVDSHPAASLSGTTASVAVIQGDVVTVANVGDSDIVWANGHAARVVSVRHRPDRESERRRVERAGGVVRNGYICDPDENKNKMIAVSRTLGDLNMRGLGVVSFPEITEFSWTADDFLILATDGLWDAWGGISAHDAVRVVRRCFDRGENARDAVDELIAGAKGRDSLPFDDTTVFVVRRGNGQA